jgi:hypothetical protein
MNASLKFLASFLTYSVLAGNPALSAPLYLQCGWGEPATDAYTFDINIQNKTVHIVVPSLDAYDVNVGEYVIEFSANRSVRYLTGGIQLGVSKSA